MKGRVLDSAPLGVDMAMTKPAGCFLQLLAIPVGLWGLIQTSSAYGRPGTEVSWGGVVFGVLLIVLAAWMLAKGRQPAVKP